MVTATISKSAFAGDRLYQIRARRALPLLVRQARASQPIRYGDLAEELEMPNPRNLNYVLGAVGRAIQELEAEWKSRIPKLTSIVVNKYTGQPSDGIIEFLDYPDVYKSALPEVRRAMVKAAREEVYAYPHWSEVLHHWHLAAAGPVGSAPQPVRGGVPEGEAHRNLKTLVAAHPEVIGLGRFAKLVGIEAFLPSGDEVDVLFSSRNDLLAIEIKAHTASDAEITRGMYQCIKYAAVLRAKQRASQTQGDAQAWLVLGRSLPKSLIPLRNTLGVHVIDEIGTPCGSL